MDSSVRADREVDVVVLGTGGAGLVAALRAADGGARVAVVERADKIGGTTAVSGGAVWIPNNHHMAAAGISDSPEEARAYLRRLQGGSSSDELLDAFITQGPAMIRYLEEHTPARFAVIPGYPDYHPDWEGAKAGGRSLDVEPFSTGQLPPDLARAIRRGPMFAPFTQREARAWGLVASFDFGLVADRISRGILTLGAALVAALVRGCVDRGIPILTGWRARRLLTGDGRITGVAGEHRGEPAAILARRGVVVATGGFEWNDEMKRQFLRGPELAPTSPPFNEGDGILMGMAVGARVGRMNEAWWMPALHVPGENLDGKPLYRLVINERTYPGSILVNRAGRRFVNEAVNYCDLGRTFHVFDPRTYDYPNIPAFLVFDERYRQRYHLATVMPGDPMPDWVARADHPAELARRIGVDPEGLAATLERFNRHAREGRDPDFHRGESIYDRYYGDRSVQPNPCLAPIEEPPFYAVQVLPGSLGTKGGLVTDASARVLDVWGDVIPGLYACGNAAASAMGAGYGGAGGTLGPGMTFGYLAGQHAASQS